MKWNGWKGTDQLCMPSVPKYMLPMALPTLTLPRTWNKLAWRTGGVIKRIWERWSPGRRGKHNDNLASPAAPPHWQTQAFRSPNQALWCTQTLVIEKKRMMVPVHVPFYIQYNIPCGVATVGTLNMEPLFLKSRLPYGIHWGNQRKGECSYVQSRFVTVRKLPHDHWQAEWKCSPFFSSELVKKSILF